MSNSLAQWSQSMIKTKKYLTKIGIHPARADFQNAYSITLATLAPPLLYVMADLNTSVPLHLCLQNVIIEGKLDKDRMNVEQ